MNSAAHNGSALSRFHPLVATWFSHTFGEPTEIQARAWQTITDGEHTLLTAPTGSGKTLAAFLWALDRLIRGHWSRGALRVLYVSPLKALNNDIQHNLIQPLTGLQEAFSQQAASFEDIRVQTRSGDTTAAERRQMLRRPPEILITTPESLNLLLSSVGGRSILTGIQTVILDEIHALIGNRRGTYLATAVERLVGLSGEFQRVALSATVRPMKTATQFVGGYQLQGPQTQPNYKPRAVVPVRTTNAKQYELSVEVAKGPDQVEGPQDFWKPYAERFRQHIVANQATLIFTNSRQLCEKLTFLINRSQEGLLAYSHHGSLSREIRTVVEQKLKSGDLRGIVATASLELGIDIGHLDEVLLVQSPPSVAEAVQRVGRAGHGVGEVSRATFYATHALDIVSAAVLVRAIHEGQIEPLTPVTAPLDVLVQVIISMAAFETWHPDGLYNAVRTAAPYRDLSRRQFDLVLGMLEGRYEDRRLRVLTPQIIFDRSDQRIKSKKGALLRLYAAGGVIPDRGYYKLRHGVSGARIGELDEEFVWEARVGQIFTLGTQNWCIRRITHSDVIVEAAPPGKPSPPFWRAEDSGRGFHLSARMGDFMEMAEARLGESDFDGEMAQDYGLALGAIKRLKTFLERQRTHTGCPLPHRHHLLIEYTAVGGNGPTGTQIVWHTLWGGRVNRPLAIALEAAWERRYGSPPEVFPSNDGIAFLLPRDVEAAEIVGLVTADNLEGLLQSRLAQSGFFGARFRECAGRSMLIPNRRFRGRMPLWLSRLKSQKLMAAVAGHAEFPVFIETWRTCLQDEFDLVSLRRLLREVAGGGIGWSVTHTATPSPLARSGAFQHINHYMYQLDQPAPAGGGRVSEDLFREVALEPGLRPQLDPSQVARFESKRQRLIPGYTPGTADALYEWLKERVLLPVPEWDALLDAVERDHGKTRGKFLTVLKDKTVVIRSVYANCQSDQGLVVLRETLPRVLATLYRTNRKSIVVTTLSGRKLDLDDLADPDLWDPDDHMTDLGAVLGEWLSFYGPRTPDFVRDTLGLSGDIAFAVLNGLVETETILRGHLVTHPAVLQICDRENFEILLRQTRRAAKTPFEPLSLNQLPLYLAHYQGIVTPARTDAEMLTRIDQMLAWPAPAALWETDLLPVRRLDYRPVMLDRIVQAEALCWIGQPGRRLMFCFDSDLDLTQPLETALQEVDSDDLDRIFPDPVGRYPFGVLQQHTGLRSAVLNDQLWQAVWAGAVSNDHFDALRRGVQNKFKISEAPHPLSGALSHRHRRRASGRNAFQRWRGARPSVGNWFRLADPDRPGDLLEIEECNRERVRLLLDRYGLLFRELLQRELPGLRWAPLFRSLRLMELAGEVLGGHFFEGLDGLQFVSPRGLEVLSRPLSRDAVFWINATDPASPCGLKSIDQDSHLPRRLVTNHLVFHGADLVLTSRRSGRHLWIRSTVDTQMLPRYFQFLNHLLTRPVQPRRSITIQTINELPAGQATDVVKALMEMFETSLAEGQIVLYRRYMSDTPIRSNKGQLN